MQQDAFLYAIKDYSPKWDQLVLTLKESIFILNQERNEIPVIIVDQEVISNGVVFFDFVCWWQLNDYEAAESPEEKKKFVIRLTTADIVGVELKKQFFNKEYGKA